MFVAARLAGELCERVKLPAVVGELIVGMAVGPYALGWIGVPSSAMIEVYGVAVARDALDSVYEMLAQLGVIVLLFLVGLQTRLSDILRIGVRALIVAAGGIVASFVLLYAFGLLIGQPPVGAIFIGAAVTATSVGITARVLTDLGVIERDESRIIVGAAIIDDVLTLIVLSIVSSIGQNGSLSLGTIGLIVGEAVAFAVVVAVTGRHLARRWGHRLEHLRVPNAPFSVATAIMLGLAVLSSRIGLAAIIGAFLAGMVVSELREEYDLERQTRPLYDFLVPLFFVITGSRVDLRVLFDGSLIGVALAMAALAALGKIVGCGAGALSLGRWPALIVGVGMVPRGEVSLIVANTGLALGVMSDAIFSAMIVVVVLTTLVVPPSLAILCRARARGDEAGTPSADSAGADASSAR
jgi:Kef-type K+ transport system membrane component KefB